MPISSYPLSLCKIQQQISSNMDPKDESNFSSSSPFPIPPNDAVNLAFETFSPLQSLSPFEFDFADEYEAKPVVPLSSSSSSPPPPPPPVGFTPNFPAPQPLECLQGNPIPPFLSKTYDLVEEPALDPIISWGGTGESFVVWDPLEFARIVLPRNFKHNNFSSFVRQLNTYGFRKIDTDKWEFANESFLRGSKHLLKNIRRRRTPPHSQQATSDASGPGLETELEKLRKDKSVLMQELVELQKQHLGTAERVETVKQRLQASEQRQKQMVSFLAKAFQNPELVERLRQAKEQRLLDSPRTRRQFVTQKPHEDEQISEAASPEMLISSFPQHCPIQETMPFQTENVSSVQMEGGGAGDQPLYKGKELASAQLEYFVDFPETGSLINQEDELGMGFDFSMGVASSTVDLWSTDPNYEFLVPGPSISGGVSDVWDLGAIRSSEIGKWPSDESPPGSGSN